MKSCHECAATYPDDYAVCPKDGAPLYETTLWQIGTIVRGKYRILARLGEGGMAVVYKAHHELLDEDRALKVIKPGLAHDAEFMGRFKNEAIIARKLNHPNAVRVDDLDIAEDGLPFIAMELVVGDALETLIRRAGPLPVSMALDIASNVCEALDAAHKLGLVHRDIKPENIVLIPQREGPTIAKILDFGISRLRDGFAGSKGLTRAGMVIGTPEFMSPEQALGKRDRDIDGRSDLYSLGMVMYYMLTGEMPFEAESTAEMILQHLKTPPKPPHELKPELGIPKAVSAIVMKALEKDREKRFATGAEMAAALKQARGSSTHRSTRVDWEKLNTSVASFGTEEAAATPRPQPSLSASYCPAIPAGAASANPPPARTLYLVPPRAAPSHRYDARRRLWMLLAVAVLVASGFAAWEFRKYAKQSMGGGQPAKATGFPSATEQKTLSPGSSSLTVPHGQPSARRNPLSSDQQAKVIELNSLAAIYYKEGGCEKALPLYQRVLVIDPGNPRAYAAVEKCYAQARNGVKPNPTGMPGTLPNP